ncbi:MAG TPA: beta-galactosidase [Terriglobia bacterium]|nr:beta-galactosidase [Terriglobia bacterium]
MPTGNTMRRYDLLLLILLAGALCCIPSSAVAQTRGARRAFDLIAWNGGQFIYGVDYYPEVWNEAQWEKDAANMQAAGINFVRLGEFAWAKMEPSEGQYNFGWLDRALEILSAHGIKAVLGTPTASPPAWLMAKYPDIAAMNEDGVRYRYGSRRNYCLHNPHFLAAAKAIVTAEAEHFKNNPAVLGWQIDNEVGGPYCYDSYCLAAFQNWCRAKYQTLEALNQAWGTIFWGHTYSAWSQIPLPWNTLYGVHNPGLELDYHRFFSDATPDFVNFQAQILRQVAPQKAITTNEMGLFDAVDYSRLNTLLDFVAWDNYPMIFNPDYQDYFRSALGHDLMRGSKEQQNFMVMEQEGGLPGWTSFWGKQAPAALYRVWAYQAIAHGADGVCYFRWRTSRFGTEQYWQGVLDQDGYLNARYRMIAQMGKEVKRLTLLLQGSHTHSQVALLVSPDTRWAFHIQPTSKSFDYYRQLFLYYDAARRLGLNVDVVFPQMDFAGYRVIVAPSLFVVSQPLVQKLTQFVGSGGTLVLTYRSGVKDDHNEVTLETLPGPLARLAGVLIHDFDPQVAQKQEIVEQDGSRYSADVWYDILTPTTARTLATYGKRYYAGKPAMTENSFEKGSVFYIGAQPSSAEFYDRLMKQVFDKAEVVTRPTLPNGVELATREKAGEKIFFLMNYTNQDQSVNLGELTHNALTGASESAVVRVPAYGVQVLTAR